MIQKRKIEKFFHLKKIYNKMIIKSVSDPFFYKRDFQ
jgi:hypothetical protein